MRILVTGGAGYIGSHIAQELRKKYKVIVFDNLSNGHIKAVPKDVVFVKGDLSNKKLISKTIKENKINAIIHLAGSILVGESVKDPHKYFQNNIINGLNLLNAVRDNGVRFIVFSSSAAVYGEPIKIPVKEDHPTCPTSPYGLTKLIFEQILGWYDIAYGIRFISLRYFNAAGADPSGEIGEDHNPETHLIPLVLQVAQGKRREIKIFGTDYKTKDGTCIRDYIHVTDLATAHILALQALLKGKESSIYNLGNGKEYSVREVIETAKQVTNKEIKIVKAERRSGDPAVLVASSQKINKELGWRPKFRDLKAIIKTAWLWQQKKPEGFK